MRKVAFLALLLAGCCSVPREPHPNLGVLRQECVSWYDSGGYERAFSRAAESARRTAECMKVVPGRTAVVFDIDETLLTNWKYLEKTGCFLELPTFTRWVKEAHGTALPPTQDVHRKNFRLL